LTASRYAVPVQVELVVNCTPSSARAAAFAGTVTVIVFQALAVRLAAAL
jgi:hypothetical protein